MTIGTCIGDHLETVNQEGLPFARSFPTNGTVQILSSSKRSGGSRFEVVTFLLYLASP